METDTMLLSSNNEATWATLLQMNAYWKQWWHSSNKGKVAQYQCLCQWLTPFSAALPHKGKACLLRCNQECVFICGGMQICVFMGDPECIKTFSTLCHFTSFKWTLLGFQIIDQHDFKLRRVLRMIHDFQLFFKKLSLFFFLQMNLEKYHHYCYFYKYF